MSVDFTIALPLLASGVAVIASVLKNATVRKNVLSTVVITRSDGSTIKLEAEKTSEDELKKIIEQVARIFPAHPEKEAAGERKEEINDRR